MRALRVLPGLDATFGGPSESSVNASIATHRAGVDTTVVVPLAAGDPDAGSPGVARLQAEGITVVRLPLLRFPAHRAYRWGVSGQTRRWLRGAVGAFDIVHAHSAWTHPALVVMTLSPSPPKVLTPHESLTDFDVGRSGMPGMRQLKRHLRPFAIKRADHIVFSSELERATSGADDDRCDVIYHPVLDEREARAATQPAHREGSARVLGFIGRFDPKKNLELALQALAHLPASYRLIAAGDGPPEYVARLKQMATEIGVADRVSWPGFVQEEAKSAFFADIDALLMPSQFECFGMSAAEAITHGVPVVLSPHVGAAPIVTEFACGRIAELDPAAIAAAARSIVDDRETWQELAQQAARAADARLSFAAHGTAQRACYERLLQRRRDDDRPVAMSGRS